MKIIDESIELARALFPIAYKEKEKGIYRTFHFAFIFYKSTLISVGVNSFKENPKIYKLGKKFRNRKQYLYAKQHAEMDAISKIIGKFYIDKKCILISLRLSANLNLQNARPCKECYNVIRAFGIKHIYYSTKDQTIDYLYN